ncbi:MAG TPA: GAF domain-containing sensor histidine kinase [Allosphingosinicella sp.]|nr:GAF domain-containing sensor histidine kinase [Allosphingosinicella sp.]
MADDIERALGSIAAIDAVPTILEVVCRVTGMGFAAIARVTEDRWIACAVRDEIAFGLAPGGELKVETTICDEIRDHGEPVIIDHVAEDQVYCGHPTPALYGFQSYISIPIRRSNGDFFGTLCAIDPRPARLANPETIGMFRLFADLIAFHLDTREQLATSESALLDARRTAELREQFIAVLGHDLRNPLASIEGGARLLESAALDEKGRRILTLMHGSVRRMAGLIDNVLDLARGQLGGGIAVKREPADLAPALIQVIAELRTAQPDRAIDVEIALDRPIPCDRARIAQLFSNLLANALSHGAQGRPVSVRAGIDGDVLTLAVANQGDPIPAETRERLFQPFFRAPGRTDREGLGLGLYIASEIARAHNGRIDVSSTDEETRFTFTMDLE